jgi:hypothetical protein
MADVRIGQRDWPRLRGSKLFICPQIAQAYYEDRINKVELEEASKSSGKKPISARISSDVCDLVPVRHEKADSALAAFNVIMARKYDCKKPYGPETIVASVFRPASNLPGDSLNLFSTLGVKEKRIEQLSGLAPDTIENIRSKGRLNGHTCAVLGRVAVAAHLYANVAQSTTARFPEATALQSLMAWQPLAKKDAKHYANDLLLAASLRHELLDRYIQFVVAQTEFDSESEEKAVRLARRPLREFFTTAHKAVKTVVAIGDDDKYLIDFKDQIPAPEEWRNWD